MPADDRDHQPPKSGRLWQRPQSTPAAPTAVYEDVTGRFDTLEAENEARFRRDVIRSLRAVSLKVAAGNRVFRDELRQSREERERRRADEAEQRQRKEAAKQRRHQIVKRLISKEVLTALGAAIAGVVAALKATGSL